MVNNHLGKAPFDPGFSQLATNFPKEVYGYLDEIAGLKQNHQKKFAFTHLENQIVPIIKQCASFYLGCILWGSYLLWKYKNDVREIEGNPLLSTSEQLNIENEIAFILGFIDKFEKSAQFYLKRSSRINLVHLKYLKIYTQFVGLNNDFKNLKFTNEIKLPAEVAHFEHFNEQKLDELKQKIDEIINSESLENILHLGFYN